MTTKSRMMIQKAYRDTRTGETFLAWRTLKGWRLALLSALARLVTAGKATVQRRTGYVLITLGLVLLPFALSGCSHAQKAEAQRTQTVQFEARTTEEREKKPAIYCGAPTKDGGRCRRRVKKEGEHCFMHRDAK
jgi:hypothetical protein